MTEQLENEYTTDDDCCLIELGDTVHNLVRLVHLFERDQIKPYGFTTTQAYVLIELYNKGSLQMSELSDKLNVKISTMTRVVDKLVRDKYLSRERSADDKRVVNIYLSIKGTQAASKLIKSINKYYQDIISFLPSGRVVEVLECTSLLIKAFEKANPECC
jgi:DNA-binding MarR family transcriptional regulator